ncbi:MAG: hypothetical protein ACK5V3_00040 [Bdellovibrionales bacterium]
MMKNFIFTLLAISIAFNSFAITNANNNQIEFYSDRPNVLELRARTTKNTDWQNLNWAQLEFIAQLLGLYPQQHLYFLARDGEYLFDLALVLTEHQPALRKRLHLINVSRNNQSSSNLKKYLVENGLTDEFIVKYGVVFVDSGYSGSIAKHIQTKYPKNVQKKMQIHLIESQDEAIPASETFKSRDALDVSSYEEMVRYFDRSNRFKLVDGRLVPVSPKGHEEPYDSDGTVDKKEALRYMQSMTAFGRTKTAQLKFQERLRQWQYLSDVAQNPNYSLEQVIEVLNRINKSWKSKTAVAMTQDFISFYNLNSGKKVPLGEYFLNHNQYKKDEHSFEFNFAEVLSNLSSTFSTDKKDFSERDYKDLMFVLNWNLKSSNIENIVQFFNEIDQKDFLPLIKRFQAHLGQKEFEKFFHQAVEYLNSYTYSRWIDAYKNLNLESRLIKKSLEELIKTLEPYTNEKTIRACRRAIGA